jgi:hypothetical protein
LTLLIIIIVSGTSGISTGMVVTMYGGTLALVAVAWQHRDVSDLTTE